MFDLLIGGLLIHNINYSDRVKDVSLTPQLAIDYRQFTLFVGKNSIEESMYGAAYNFNLSSKYPLRLKVGGYWQDDNLFNELGVDAFAAGDLVPVVGLDYKYYVSDKIFIYGVVTPVIDYVGIGYSF